MTKIIPAPGGGGICCLASRDPVPLAPRESHDNAPSGTRSRRVRAARPAPLRQRVPAARRWTPRHVPPLHRLGPLGDHEPPSRSFALRFAHAHRHAHRARLAPGHLVEAGAQGGEESGSAIAFAWCMVLFAMMPLWHWKGGQNPSGIRRRVDPDGTTAHASVSSSSSTRSASDRGMPIVEPPPGADVYLAAVSFQWYPDPQAPEGRGVHAPPLVARREPRVLALPDQRQLPGRARATTTGCG